MTERASILGICLNCAFFKKPADITPGNFGECRFYPATVFAEKDRRADGKWSIISLFPTTEVSSWCGQFQLQVRVEGGGADGEAS